MKHVFAFILFVLYAPCFAWGPEGHRIVGNVASDHLTPKAAKAVAQLLRDEPEPTLGGVASWADDVRGRRRDTAAFHFVNFKGGKCSYVAKRDCREGKCVVEAIRRYARVLADMAQPKETRTEALKFLVHFVGDVHQPFHASYIPDKGANEYQVHYVDPAKRRSRGRGMSLHHAWDSELIKAIDPNPENASRRLVGKKEPLRFSNHESLDSQRWAEQSCNFITDEHLYPESHKIGKEYVTAHSSRVLAQLKIAGERLAEILNQSLDP